MIILDEKKLIFSAHLSRSCWFLHPPFTKIFFSETAWPGQSKPNFNVEPPWEGGTKVCINGPGHMTKMAPIPMVKAPIYCPGVY